MTPGEYGKHHLVCRNAASRLLRDSPRLATLKPEKLRRIAILCTRRRQRCHSSFDLLQCRLQLRVDRYVR